MKDKIVRFVRAIIAGVAIVYLLGLVSNEIVGLVRDYREHLSANAGEGRANDAIKCKVTAYSNDDISIDVAAWRDGKTATGVLAKRGRIAADWSIFPPGTKLFVPGYGLAEVQDRGGKVKGLQLDLFMDSYAEAMQWGVKELEVYVIGRKS